MYIWMIVFMIYGIVIGSFLNVCIYRIPKEESVITNRSHCMECGEQIKWYDLIPLASYIVLGGKCRSCKTKISIQYPLIEFVNGFGYAIIILTNGVGLKSILYCLCASAMLALSVIDWRTFEIPVAFNIFIGILGIIRLLTDIEHWHTYVIGFVSVSGFLYLIYIITKGRGIGGGDIKLMAVAGLLVGWKNIILSLGLGCVLGSVIHVALMKIQNKDRMLAFGPYLSLGIYLSMICGEELISWYLNMFMY